MEPQRENIDRSSSAPEGTKVLLQALRSDFALKDLGELHYFLGIEVSKINNGIILSQGKYSSDILRRTGILNCKAANTPKSTSEKLSTYEVTRLRPEEATRYMTMARIRAPFDGERIFMKHKVTQHH
jgi:hypothetical protein